jgi:hypothetical protein
MHDLSFWIEIPKTLGISDSVQLNLLTHSLSVFEDIDSKIRKLKRQFFKAKSLTSLEIEALSECLSSLGYLLLRNWEEIVTTSLNLVIVTIEKNLADGQKSVIRLKKVLKMCKRIEDECIRGGQVKGIYCASKIENAIRRIDLLQEIILSRYFFKSS